QNCAAGPEQEADWPTMNCVVNASQPRREAAAPAVHMRISNQPDVLVARQKGREFAMNLGFSGSDVTVIAAAICEIARNMVDYAQGGEIRFSCVQSEKR